MERIGPTLTPEQQEQVDALISAGMGPDTATRTVLHDGLVPPRGPDGGETIDVNPTDISTDSDESPGLRAA